MATQHSSDPAKPALGMQGPFTSQASRESPSTAGTEVVSVPQIRREELVRMQALSPPAVASLKPCHLPEPSLLIWKMGLRIINTVPQAG